MGIVKCDVKQAICSHSSINNNSYFANVTVTHIGYVSLPDDKSRYVLICYHTIHLDIVCQNYSSCFTHPTNGLNVKLTGISPKACVEFGCGRF